MKCPGKNIKQKTKPEFPQAGVDSSSAPASGRPLDCSFAFGFSSDPLGFRDLGANSLRMIKAWMSLGGFAGSLEEPDAGQVFVDRL